MIKKNRAFTLTEIIIVIVIIGLMAAFALPNYMKAVAKTDERSAIANLMTIRAAVKMYLTNTGDTTIPDMADINVINTTLGISIVDPKMTYSCFSDVAGELNYCAAVHPSGWRLNFHDGVENIHCSITSPCPSCEVIPDDGTTECGMW